MAVSCAKPSVPEAQSTQVLTADNSTESSEEVCWINLSGTDDQLLDYEHDCLDDYMIMVRWLWAWLDDCD